MLPLQSFPEQLRAKVSQLDPGRLPRHVAIIMDGNGRWARQRGQDRSVGHYEGVGSVRTATELCSDLGIGYLTLYAFSTENWNRPRQEVDTLMHLIGMAIERETPDMIRNNVHVNLIGDLHLLYPEAWKRLDACCRATAHCTGLTLTLALSYSGRREIARAASLLAEKVKQGLLSTTEINDQTIAENLYTAQMPDPDLLIRTGGERRISNFLLWQSAYAEMYFSPILWPDFRKPALLDALLDYQGRQRRFGLTGDQVSSPLLTDPQS